MSFNLFAINSSHILSQLSVIPSQFVFLIKATWELVHTCLHHCQPHHNSSSNNIALNSCILSFDQ